MDKDEELDLLADLFIDAHLDLEDAVVHPERVQVEVVRETYLRLATAIASKVSGIDSAAWGGAYSC